MESEKIKQADMYCGKFEEITPHIVFDKSVDVILTDLPYGTTKAKWDTPVDLVFFWKECNRVLKKNGVILCFSQTPFDKVLGVSNLKMLRYEWIWVKSSASGHLNAKKMPMKAHENILVFYNKLPYYNPQITDGHKPVNSYTKYLETQNKTEIYGKATKEVSGGGNTTRMPKDVLFYPSDKQKINLHSTQKPLALIEYLLKTYVPPGGLVLDFCTGSGTTNQGCNNLGFDSIGVESDPEIFKKAVNRLKNLNI